MYIEKLICKMQKLQKEHQEAFKELCDEYKDMFSKGSGDIGKMSLIEMEIDTCDSLPITQKPYTLSSEACCLGTKGIRNLRKIRSDN